MGLVGPSLRCHPAEGGAGLDLGVFSCCGSGDWTDLAAPHLWDMGMAPGGWNEISLKVLFNPNRSVIHPKLVQVWALICSEVLHLASRVIPS